MEIDKHIKREYDCLKNFSELHPEIWEMIDAIISVSYTMVIELERTPTNKYKAHESQVILFWHTLIDYLLESSKFIIRKKFEIGLSCLRLASELARNSIRILEKPILYDKIMSKASDKKELRNALKFNTNDGNEKILYELYQLTSTMGIHGHLTSDTHRKPQIFFGNLVLTKISETSVLSMLTIWFMSCFTLQEKFFYYFNKKYKPNFGKDYFKFYKTLEDFNLKYDEYVREVNKKDEN